MTTTTVPMHRDYLVTTCRCSAGILGHRIHRTGCPVEADWTFDAGDPEVGIFGDLIVHACGVDEDEPEAVQVDVRMRTSDDGKMVDIITTYECPACGTQTAAVDSQPAAYFEEPRDLD